jgi:hypothetical protein
MRGCLAGAWRWRLVPAGRALAVSAASAQTTSYPQAKAIAGFIQATASGAKALLKTWR